MATGITPEFLQALYQATFAPQEQRVAANTGIGAATARKQLAQQKRAFQQDLLNQVNKPIERQVERIVDRDFNIPSAGPQRSGRSIQMSIANLRDPETLASLAITSEGDRERRKAIQERQGLLSLNLKPEVIEALQAQGYDPYEIMSATSQEPGRGGGIDFSGKVLEGVLRPELFAGLGSYTMRTDPFGVEYELSDRAPRVGAGNFEDRLTQFVARQMQSGDSYEQVLNAAREYLSRPEARAERLNESQGETFFVPEGGQTEYSVPSYIQNIDPMDFVSNVYNRYLEAGSPVVDRYSSVESRVPSGGPDVEKMQSYGSWLSEKYLGDSEDAYRNMSEERRKKAYQKQVVNPYNQANLETIQEYERQQMQDRINRAQETYSNLQQPITTPWYADLYNNPDFAGYEMQDLQRRQQANISSQERQMDRIMADQSELLATQQSDLESLPLTSDQRQAQRDAERDQRQAQRDAEREQRRADRQAEREARRGQQQSLSSNYANADPTGSFSSLQNGSLYTVSPEEAARMKEAFPAAQTSSSNPLAVAQTSSANPLASLQTYSTNQYPALTYAQQQQQQQTSTNYVPWYYSSLPQASPQQLPQGQQQTPGPYPTFQSGLQQQFSSPYQTYQGYTSAPTSLQGATAVTSGIGGMGGFLNSSIYSGSIV
jgi:hypothetical protein